MKLKCVKNTYIDGIFFKKEVKVNLTIGGVYDSVILPRVSSGQMISYVDKDEVVVMLFNDKKEWQIYPLSLFVPLYGGG